MKEKFRRCWALVLVFVIVTGVCFLFAGRKSGMFIDEIYAYGLSNSHYAPFLTDIKDGEMVGKTFTRQELFDYVAVTDGEGFDVLSGSVTGETKTQDNAFTISADAGVSLAGMVDLTAHLTAENVEAEDVSFSGGEAVDLSDPTEEQIQRVKDEIVGQAASLTISLATQFDVIGDLMTLIK